VNSQSAFMAANDGSVSCGGSGYGSSGLRAPVKFQGRCVWRSGGSSLCSGFSSADTRLCPCQCAAGTYSDSNLKSYPCSTYVCIHLLVYLWLSTFVILTVHFLL
jgi:hypothetical protein